MTIMLSRDLVGVRYAIVTACAIEANELDYLDRRLIEITSILQHAVNEGEMSIKSMLDRLVNRMDKHIQNIDGDINSSDVINIAKLLKIDPGIVSSYISDLGLKIKK